MPYIVRSASLEYLNSFTKDVNELISKGYSPLGGPAIIVNAGNKEIYQALVNSTQSEPSSEAPSKSTIKKVDSYDVDTLTVEGVKYKIDLKQNVYNEKEASLGNFGFAYKNYKERFNESNPNFYVDVTNFTPITDGGSKTKSRRSYKKYTKTSSSSRYKKNRK